MTWNVMRSILLEPPYLLIGDKISKKWRNIYEKNQINQTILVIVFDRK